jgi:hypothetical protein
LHFPCRVLVAAEPLLASYYSFIQQAATTSFRVGQILTFASYTTALDRFTNTLDVQIIRPNITVRAGGEKPCAWWMMRSRTLAGSGYVGLHDSPSVEMMATEVFEATDRLSFVW